MRMFIRLIVNSIFIAILLASNTCGEDLQAKNEKLIRQEKRNICRSFKKFGSEEGINELRKKNVEKPLGVICFKEDNTCGKGEVTLNDLYGIGFPKDDKYFEQLRSDHLVGGPFGASLVDIDSDGVAEIRIWQTVGSAHCTYNYFWKKNVTGNYTRIALESYQVLHEEGRFCHMDSDSILFVPYGGKILTVEINGPSEVVDRETIGTIWKGSASGLEEICTVEPIE